MVHLKSIAGFVSLLGKATILGVFGITCFNLGFSANENDLIRPVVHVLRGTDGGSSVELLRRLFNSQDSDKSKESKQLSTNNGR